MTILALLNMAPAVAIAENWQIDLAQSRLGYEVVWDGEPSVATFKKWDAQIVFDPADPAHAKVTVTIDVGSSVSDLPQYDSSRLGPLGFDASKYPQATFITQSFRATGPNQYEATGDLTIKGVTKSVVLPFVLMITGDTAHMTGQVSFLRTDFNVGTGSSMGISFDSDKPVARKVTVTADISATKVPAPPQ